MNAELAVAVAACAVAALALAAVLLLWRRVATLRGAQSVILGSDSGDLLEFAVALQARIDKRVDGCLSHTSIVRYDAYEDAGGHQSASLAFLDAARSGVVVSAIQGRDYARIYVKELDRGRASVALSPEEQQAVDRAMSY